MSRVARVAVVAMIAGCHTPEPVAPEAPSSELPPSPVDGRDEVTLALADVIVMATPLEVTFRDASHGGLLLHSRPRHGVPGLQDRGTLVVTTGTDRCGGDLDGDVAVTTCGNLIVVYQQGVVTLIRRTPSLENLGQSPVPDGATCGTHAIDGSVTVRTTQIEIHGYRTVRCSGTPAPMIF